jgi:hypothetical protein
MASGGRSDTAEGPQFAEIVDKTEHDVLAYMTSQESIAPSSLDQSHRAH